MSRSLLHTSYARNLVTFGLPVAAALAISGSALALSRPEGLMQSSHLDRAALAAALQPNRYCYTWDFLNNTGQDVNELHIRLAGIQTIGAVYTGTLNAFGDPDGTSGYDSGAGIYQLNFISNTVEAGDLNQIGICADQPVLALDSNTGTPPFSWSVDGTPLAPAPGFAGLTWNWVGRNHLSVQLTNDPQVSMTLLALNVLDAGTPLSLDDLNGTVAADLPLVNELAPDPMDLAPGVSNTYDVFFASAPPGPFLRSNSAAASSDAAPLLEPNHPYVIEAVLASADDPTNLIHLYSQSLSPLATLYLPVLLRP